MSPQLSGPSESGGSHGTPDDLSCPVCGERGVRTAWTRTQFPYGVGADTVTLSAIVPVQICQSCGFEFLDHDAERLRHEAVCVHLAVLAPSDIKKIRDDQGMSRADFARVTRFGEATVARWERGELIQSAANDRYLRLLQDPEVFERLLRLAGTPPSQSTTTEMSSRSAGFRALGIDRYPALRTAQANFSLRRLG